jgi:hypothetical protein
LREIVQTGSLPSIRGKVVSVLRTREQELETENEKLRAQLYGNREPDGGSIDGQQERAYGEAGTTQKQPTPDEAIEWLFTFHDDPDKTPHYVEIREAAKTFAKVILRHTPGSGDKILAIQKVREAVMFANAGIALDGRA